MKYKKQLAVLLSVCMVVGTPLQASASSLAPVGQSRTITDEEAILTETQDEMERSEEASFDIEQETQDVDGTENESLPEIASEEDTEEQATETAEMTEESATVETTEDAKTTETVEETEALTLDGTSEGTAFLQNKMTYEVLSATERTVKLKEATGYLMYDDNNPREIVVPATVEYEDTTYSVVEIGDFAFADYTYDEYNQPGNNDMWNATLGIDKVTVSAGIQKIGKGAFYRSSQIAEIVLPDTVEEIGESAFYFEEQRATYGTYLTVNIPTGVKMIGNYAYHGVTFSDVLKIPDWVQSIGKYAFACEGEYSGIYCVEIPDSVTTIMSYAFDIPTLERVAFHKEDPVFVSGVNLTSDYNSMMFGEKESSITIYVPSSALETYRNSALKNYIPNAVYKIIDEYAVLKESPIKFLYGGKEIESEFVVSTNTSKTMTVDKGEAEFAYSDINWSFSYYGGNTRLTQDETNKYFAYEANEDGTVEFTAKEQPKNFTVYAEVDGYKPVSVNLVLIDGYTNAAFLDTVEALTDDDIENMKKISAGNTAAESQLAAIREKAQEITEGCTTDRGKIEAVHRWVSYHISYDYDTLYYAEDVLEGAEGMTFVTCPDTPYAILQNRYSVCDGYAKLSEAMLRSIGIPAAYIGGYADGDFYGKRLGHAWNMAYDGEE